MNGFVVSLDSRAARLAAIGGKGANLAKLARLDFPVPPGFCITTAAYRAFLDANRLPAQLAELDQTDHTKAPLLSERTSRAIRDLFARGSIPADVTQDITAEYRQLITIIPRGDDGVDSALALLAGNPGPTPAGLGPVAVRSSAMAEDLPHASFAGQYDTYLNIIGEDALLRAVKRCWASLWTARALAYGAHRGLDPGVTEMAVVVQQLVPAEIAGVLYTIDPTSGNSHKALINAAWGLGQAIVEGRVTPDIIAVEKSSGRVTYRTVGDKTVMIVPAAAGDTAEVPVPPELRRQPALNPEKIIDLVRLGRAIEARFGAPQDVEWAIARGRVYILQARPVTRLPSVQPGPSLIELPASGDDEWPAVGEQPAQKFDLWTQANVGEIWPHPVSPLMWSGVPFIVNSGMGYALRGLNSPYLAQVQWAKRFYGRIYYNEGALAYLLSEEFGLPGAFVDAALGSRRRGDHPLDGRFRPGRFIQRLPYLIGMTMRQLRTGQEFEELFPKIDHWLAVFSGQRPDRLSDRQLWAVLTEWIDRFMAVIKPYMELSSSSIAAFALLERLTLRWLGTRELAYDLITGLSNIHSLEMSQALSQMAQMLTEAGQANIVLTKSPRLTLTELRQTVEAQPMLQMLERFLRRYGHHCPNEGEWLYPRWADAPEQVVGMIAGYLRAGDRFGSNQAKVRRRREQALALARSRLDPIRRLFFEFINTRTQHLVRLRDNGKNYYIKAAYPVRKVSVRFGRRWAKRGWLEHPDDIFFLTFPEIEQIVDSGAPATAGLDLTALVVKRRRMFHYWFTIEPPEVIDAGRQPVVFQTTIERTGSVLWGIPASNGQVRGQARLVPDFQAASRLQPGDILVTRATDPGWTPLFPLVGGLVIEVGGQLSHAAIAAREYGVPAVVNVPNAVQRLQDGQMITVDGTNGCIYLGRSSQSD